MTKSQLIEALGRQLPYLAHKDVELSVNCVIEQMIETLVAGDKIEIRGFGSFSLRCRYSCIGRNPKTSEKIVLTTQYVPHFKMGKELRDRVNASRKKCKIINKPK